MTAPWLSSCSSRNTSRASVFSSPRRDETNNDISCHIWCFVKGENTKMLTLADLKVLVSTSSRDGLISPFPKTMICLPACLPFQLTHPPIICLSFNTFSVFLWSSPFPALGQTTLERTKRDTQILLLSSTRLPFCYKPELEGNNGTGKFWPHCSVTEDNFHQFSLPTCKTPLWPLPRTPPTIKNTISGHKIK